jgi:hypothetical protein
MHGRFEKCVPSFSPENQKGRDKMAALAIDWRNALSEVDRM